MPTARIIEPGQINWHGLFEGASQISYAEGKPRTSKEIGTSNLVEPHPDGYGELSCSSPDCAAYLT